MTDRIAIYHEHPDWFRPLFAELERREVPFLKLDAGVHTYDPTERRPDFSLVFNRASPSSYLRGHLGTIFSTWSWLSHLDRIGIPVVNGSRMFTHEISKARQLNALEELGVAYPRARVINSPAAAVAASRGLRFPIVVKANVGGSGAGITRFDSEAALADAVAAGPEPGNRWYGAGTGAGALAGRPHCAGRGGRAEVSVWHSGLSGGGVLRLVSGRCLSDYERS